MAGRVRGWGGGPGGMGWRAGWNDGPSGGIAWQAGWGSAGRVGGGSGREGGGGPMQLHSAPTLPPRRFHAPSTQPPHNPHASFTPPHASSTQFPRCFTGYAGEARSLHAASWPPLPHPHAAALSPHAPSKPPPHRLHAAGDSETRGGGLKKKRRLGFQIWTMFFLFCMF